MFPRKIEFFIEKDFFYLTLGMKQNNKSCDNQYVGPPNCVMLFDDVSVLHAGLSKNLKDVSVYICKSIILDIFMYIKTYEK